MLLRSAIVAAVLVLLAPLAARADLWINYKGLDVLSVQRGCHLESHNPTTKTSVTRCGPYEMTRDFDSTTYSEAWGRATSDPRYGGCATAARTIAWPPATHQFGFVLRGQSARSPLVCHSRWVNNNTVEVWFTDKP